MTDPLAPSHDFSTFMSFVGWALPTGLLFPNGMVGYGDGFNARSSRVKPSSIETRG
jgi:hypothetical protein